MAVAHVVSSASHTSGSFSVSQASFSWTHTTSTDPQGVLVFVFQGVSATDAASSVTYGGVNVPSVSGGRATDTTTEPGSVEAFYLGSGVPTTNNPTIQVNRTNNTTTMWAVCVTVTAGADTETAGVVLLQNDGTIPQQSVNDGSVSGTNSVRYAGAYYGGASPAPAGAASTLLHSDDAGAYGWSAVRETTAGQGARSVGFNATTSDDRAAVHLAIREVLPPVTGTAAVTQAADVSAASGTTSGGGGMAFAVTARGSGNSGTTSAQTRAASSATPTANSLFLVCWSSQHDASAAAPTFQTPTGGSLTYTQVRTAGDATSYPWNGDDSFRVGSAVYSAPVGGSPSAFVATVDSSSGTTSFYYGVVCLDITGHDTSGTIVQTAIAGGTKSTGDTETGTVTFGSALTPGNLILVVFGAGADNGGGFALPTAGAGKTMAAVTNQNSAFCQTGVFQRTVDGSESTTITCSDLGQTVGNYSAIAIEIKAAGGGGTTGTVGVTQAGQTSSAAGQLGYSGTSARTEAADTSSAAGTVVNPVTGTSAAAQANQTSTASGQLGYSGTSARTQAAQTSSASGQLGYTGTSARTQATQTSTASGSFTAGGSFSGTAAVTQAANTASASGTFTPGSITGTASAAQANQAGAASGKLGYSGTSARTQANNTSIASGTVVNPVTGTASPVQGNQTSSAVGKLGYTGASSTTEARDTSSGAGVVSGPVSGSAAVTQASQTASIAGYFAALVSFGTSSAGVGVVPSSHPNAGLAPFSTPANGSAPSATGATSTAPTSTGA